MKNYKTLVAAVAVGMALVATERSAEAALSGTSYLTQSGGTSPSLQVNWTVTQDPTYWLYSYSFSVGSYVDSIFTPTTANPVTSLTIDASFVTAGSATSADGAGVAINSSDVVWTYGQVTFGNITLGTPYANTDTVTFKSAYGPTLGGASANDGVPSVSWSAAGPGANPVPVPAPVPEASTVMAGALMLLPFGIGAIRSLRKERAV